MSVKVRPEPKTQASNQGSAVSRKQDGGALRQHTRKECARSIRLQRTVKADVASLHDHPVAETVYNARRQQGPTKGVRSGGPHRRGISGDMMRTTACQLERPSTPRRRNPAEEALPITVSGKWKRRRQGVGSGQTVLLMGVQQNAPGGKARTDEELRASKRGKGEMIKAPIALQELRRRIYRKAKSEKAHRFWGIFVHVTRTETLEGLTV